MVEKECNLKVIDKDNLIECRTVCLIHFMEFRCCEACDEINKCKRVCGFMRDKRKKTIL